MYRADRNAPIGNELGDPRALRSRKREIESACDPFLEQVEVLGQCQMQIVQVRGIDERQRLGEKIGLLLIVSLEANAVAGRDNRLKGRGDVSRLDDLSAWIADLRPST